LTSVSAYPVSGQPSIIPYGVFLNGNDWIDPTGANITSSGTLPSKGIILSSSVIATAPRSVIDTRGGGDLFAYQWNSGLKGTIDPTAQPVGDWQPISYRVGNKVTYLGDTYSAILATTSTQPEPTKGKDWQLYWAKVPQTYAILPGFGSGLFPVGRFAQTSLLGISSSTVGDPGYSSSSLTVGDSITLTGGGSLAPGTYTLLPSRYALLPGAFLVTPLGRALDGQPSVLSNPDGSTVQAGVRFNLLNPAVQASPVASLFLVDSPANIASVGDYHLVTASQNLPSDPSSHPVRDAGSILIEALPRASHPTDPVSMNLQGMALTSQGAGGRGAVIDLSSTANFRISGPGALPLTGGSIALDELTLSSWQAGSLLIGGYRTITSSGTRITPTSSLVTVENTGDELSAYDLILVSKGGVTIGEGSSLVAIGGDSSGPITVSGNGSLLRLSGDPSASMIRTGYDPGSGIAGLTIGKGVVLDASAVLIDSSGSAVIDQTATLGTGNVSLNAGRISLNFDGTLDGGALNLSGLSLSRLSRAASLSLTSYSTIGFRNSGPGALTKAVLGSDSLGSLSLHAGELLGDGAGNVTLVARTILLDNRGGVVDLSTGSPYNPYQTTGSANRLSLEASLLTLGQGNLAIGGFGTVSGSFSSGIIGRGVGSFAVSGDLLLKSPSISEGDAARTSVKTSRLLDISYGEGSPSTLSGLAAKLSLTGSSIRLSAPVLLPSGCFSALATTGNVEIASSGSLSSPMKIDVSGTAKNFSDAVRFTDAGAISLDSSSGNVILDAGTSLLLGANESGGSAGSLTCNAPAGMIELSGTLSAPARLGAPASFSADVRSIDALGFKALETSLFAAGWGHENGFTKSQSLRVRSGDIVIPDAGGSAAVRAWSFELTADTGSVTVSGRVDASQIPEVDPEGNTVQTGGFIGVFAGKSITLTSTGVLDVHGNAFNNAGKGGAIELEAGNNPTVAVINPTASLDVAGRFTTGSVLDLAQGIINLYVGTDSSHQLTPRLGQASGTLHLRAPQTGDAKDVQVNPIGATIVGASAINVEGFLRQDAATVATVTIDDPDNPDNNMKAVALNNASSFMANYHTIGSRLKGANASILQINPGEQIENSRGGLLLSSDWDFSLARYGPKAFVLDLGPNPQPVLDGDGNPVSTGTWAGYLTLRAAGDVTFHGALSDGFGDSLQSAANVVPDVYGSPSLYLAPLLPLVSDGSRTLHGQQSWTYLISAGADFRGANPSSVSVNANVNVGVTGQFSNASLSDDNVPGNYTADTISGYYQAIRTGTGDITLTAGGSIRYLNQFSTTYTTGSRVIDPSLGNRFDLPNFYNSADWIGTDSLGYLQIPDASIAPQYSTGGGNVSLHARANIEHIQFDGSDSQKLSADSSFQLPVNWLSRNGYQDASGNWGSLPAGGKASLTWWVNFANFFEGVATLGGGNLVMQAGGDISNVDASVATQARMTVRDEQGNTLTAAQGSLVETGGGDLLIKAGGDLDAGVYYQERGNAEIDVSGSIISNQTRNAKGLFQYSQAKLLANNAISDEQKTELLNSSTWLPTSFLLGKGRMTVSAGSDALIGSVANAFLLAPGIQNALSSKTYFSTYDQTYLDLSGVRHKDSTFFGAESTTGNLSIRTMVYGKPDFSGTGRSVTPISASRYQPWTRASETISAVPALMPARISLAALSKGISLQGNITLAPHPNGNLIMAAATSINGVYQTGAGESSSSVNVSDASPSLVPSVMLPRAQASLSDTYDIVNLGDRRLLSDLNSAMVERGSYLGTTAPNLQAKLSLHGSSLLHSGDGEPLVMEAMTGSLSGLTLFSPKSAHVSAGTDIFDVAIFVQNTHPAGKTIISAGRDLRSADPGAEGVLHNSGDIQISGPGSLEVLAGGSINLGKGLDNGDGTGLGITSIGNARNPNLPFNGADISVLAGVGSSLSSGLEKLLSSAASSEDSSRYFQEVGEMLLQTGNNGIASAFSSALSWNDLLSGNKFSEDYRSRIALVLFNVILRDAGRDHNNPDSPGYGSYQNGEKAIATVFKNPNAGDIVLNARDIRSKSGGSISMYAPGGAVSLSQFSYVASLSPPGIVSEHGGNVSIYSKGNLSLGIGRVFTLRGGDIMIWSDKGDIAAGSSAKTVASAPPTRVLIDPQSGDVLTDLAGLATGGGIGVLATVKDAPVGNVDLIAPSGVIDAGDAGIRSSGNLNLAATKILNADNIAVAGISVGAPPAAAPASAPPPAAPPVSAPAGASAAAAAANNAAEKTADKGNATNQDDATPSVFSIDIMGYGGGEGDDDDSRKKAADTAVAPVQASL